MEGYIIPFEVAKLAKEKGFKELCYHFYLNNGKLYENKVYSYNEGEVFFELSDLKDNFNNGFKRTINGDSCFGCNNNIYMETFSAPRRDVLQMWLMKRGYLIYIYPFKNNTIMFKNNISNNEFKSWNEALDNGLLEILKQL